MLKKKITYTDYDDNERTEEFHFNLTKAELLKMNLGRTGGLTALIEKIQSTQDMPKIIELFEEIVCHSYGEKSPDGKRFIKNEELLDEFKQTEAYSQLFVDLATDSKAAAAFIHGVVPKELAAEMDKQPKITAE